MQGFILTWIAEVQMISIVGQAVRSNGLAFVVDFSFPDFLTFSRDIGDGGVGGGGGGGGC